MAPNSMEDNFDSSNLGDAITTTTVTITTSPMLRPVSPSSSVSPSLASGACPSLLRSASMPSTASSVSSRSVSSSSQPSEASSNHRRRNGFMRPQGTAFADSARHRDSVMCLGSIAALQYYFARTGLLEGKGAQMAKDTKITRDTAAAVDVEEGAADPDADGSWEFMAPPAVSTYRHKEPVTEPLPETPVLRRQLREALDYARKALEDCAQDEGSRRMRYGSPTSASSDTRHVERQDEGTTAASLQEDLPDDPAGRPTPQGWEDAQGLYILDVVTLAIRQARVYYVTHAHPQALYALRSEREIRADLYRVLDVLKRMASRSFRGGIRSDELSWILSWIQGIHHLLSQEEKQEEDELASRHNWQWREGDWQGRELERERLFLCSFDLDPTPLPEWEESSSQPSAFLLALSKGLRLVHLHNEIVRQSNRPFGLITTFYTDLAKPYRCAENLRFWAKAAELRWEIKLNFNALAVVHGENEEAWLHFDQAVRTWCKAVREELTQEWTEAERGASDGKAVTAS